MARHREELGDADDPEDGEDAVDLHGMAPERALRRLAQELHACRMRRRATLLVITGRGFGNRTQRPILRTHVEGWLRGAEGARAGVVSFELASKGGALLVRVRAPSEPRGKRAHDDRGRRA